MITPDGLNALFDNGPPPAPPTGRYVLWYAPSGCRRGWQVIFQGETEAACVAFMADHRANGKYRVLPAAERP